MSAKLIGSRTGVRLNVESISKDAMGFDDLDEFWNASGKFSSYVYTMPRGADKDTDIRTMDPDFLRFFILRFIAL
jgi:hypothetical protein